MDKKKNRAIEKVENLTQEVKTQTGENVGDGAINGAIEGEGYSAGEYEKRVTAVEDRAMERLAEAERKQKLKEQKLKIKREKMYLKQKAREQKLQQKAAKKTGVGGWVAAVVALSMVALVFATLFVLESVGVKNVGGDDIATRQAYYEFVNYVDSMDVDMSKLMVSKDEKKQQRLLTELSAKAQLASASVARLPLKDESKFYTTKFVNQVGDYSKYLNNKLIDGLSVTEEDIERFENLYKINRTLKEELSSLTFDMGADFDFAVLSEDGKQNQVTDKFEELESNAVDYPKLIYDGPFSDGLDAKTPVGLVGEELTLSQAEDAVREYFADYGVSDIEPKGENAAKIQTYNFDCTVEGGEKLFAQISKKGGKLVAFEFYKDCTESNYDLGTCEGIALKFLQKAGFSEMKAVWATEKGAVAYINFVHRINGVIAYPDMVKVTVCKERGVVSSLDAREYWLNHKPRTLGKVALTALEAQAKVNDGLTVKSCRLAIVPYGNDREVLTYEISGEYSGATYYVYIDAVSGKEVEIFRVVETTEGTLLI